MNDNLFLPSLVQDSQIRQELAAPFIPKQLPPSKTKQEPFKGTGTLTPLGKIPQLVNTVGIQDINNENDVEGSNIDSSDRSAEFDNIIKMGNQKKPTGNSMLAQT